MMYAAIFSVLLIADASALPPPSSMPENPNSVITVTSSAFKNGGKIPTRNAGNGCGGQNVSPQLRWKNPQAALTKSYVIICQDFDVPHPLGTPEKVWDHWVVYNIPATITDLSEGVLMGENQLGKNSYGKVGYDGPCPPKGQSHHYFFNIYGLNTMLDFDHPPTKDELLNKIKLEELILAEGTIMGSYP